MPREIFPSSYECDCGHRSHFSENTIREAKQKSHKMKVFLIDSEPDEHTIVFYRGEMVEILCPHRRPDEKPVGKVRHRPSVLSTERYINGAREEGSGDKTVAEKEIPIATFNTETEALMWAELLKNEGIPCVLVPLGAGVSAFGPSVWRPFELRVRESDVQRAKLILSS